MATVSLQSAYDQTRNWIESNDPARAIGLAQHILDHYPKNLEAYRILGEAYLASRQLDKAQESFDRVLRSDPENIPAHVGLGITYERQGKLDRAVPEFEQAWEIKPDMAELRSQLLRLYSEAWGSEHAQLRLSRAGLARLYAKGYMLPQAITEFRQVIADQPNRHDAKIALAEALWRDGQENDAIALAREILAQQPESLKANLLLGYLLLARGQPEGQQYWDAATAIDPQMTVAQAMFETLPSEPETDLDLPEWDEAAWQRQQELEKQPVPAATRPIPVAETEPARATPVFANANNNDDFLAVLLGGAAAPKSAPAPIEVSDEPIAANPFSLDDIDLGGSIPASQTSEAPTTETVATPAADDQEPNLTPFSFSDLGLSDEEIASLDSATTTDVAPAETSTVETDQPNLTPFSFSDLGLSDEEIASLDSAATSEDVPAETPAQDADEPDLMPFSFSDLGLSDEEIASLDSATETANKTPSVEEDEPSMTPFSLADLGLTDDEIASLDNTTTTPTSTEAQADDDVSNLTPFSFADLGLSDDEIASLNELGGDSEESTTAATAPATTPEEEEPNLTPFSLSDLGLSDEEIAGLDLGQSSVSTESAQASASDDQDLPAELLPFSLDDLDTSNAGSSLPPSLQPFSLDEVPPEQPRISNFSAPESSTNRAEPIDDEDTASQTGGYSWQQPTQRSRPSYTSSTGERDPLMPEGESIFSKLKQRREREGDLAAPEPPASNDDTLDDRILFSSDDISLRDDHAEMNVAQIEPNQNPTSPQVSDQLASAGGSEDLSSGIQSGQIQPFSLSDLGLSSEEIAALGLGGNSGTAQSFTSMLGETAPTANESTNTETESPTAEAPAVNQATPAPEPAVEEESEIGSLTPFSFSDLGLSDEEIAALGLDEGDDEASGLDLTDEELAGLDMGGDIDLSSANAPGSATTGSDDPLLDKLMALGREQGYVDIADIMAGVDNPEAEADRIEQIGQLLHENNIKIFDGDEEVDMDAEYTAEDESDLSQIDFGDTASSPTRDEPDMTPFSLSDLGLTDDEIASLGLGENQPSSASAAPAAGEPDVTPFSLSDLGLDDEIASFNLPEEQTSTPAPATSDEPSMTPFSLADLGLNDDEIASLDLGEEQTSTTDASATTDEPEMTPFSLADLGLTDDEIASLGLGEESGESTTDASATTDEPEMTPFSLADLGLTDDEIASLGLEEISSEQPEAGQPATESLSLDSRLGETVPLEQAVPDPVPTQPTPEPQPASVPTSTPLVQPRQSPGLSNSLAESVPALRSYLEKLDAEPQNHTLRLSLARISGQLGQTEASIQQYKNIVRQNVLLDTVAEDLGDLISDTDDSSILHRLHRLLGDVYSKQGRIDEAIKEYNWTLGN